LPAHAWNLIYSPLLDMMFWIDVFSLDYEIHLGSFAFNKKFWNFWNGDKWYRNFLGKFQKILKIAKFPKCEPFIWKFWKLQEENQMERNSYSAIFENLGVTSEVVLFSGNFGRCCSIHHLNFWKCKPEILVECKVPLVISLL